MDIKIVFNLTRKRFIFAPRFRNQKLILVSWFSMQGERDCIVENEKCILIPELRYANLYLVNILPNDLNLLDLAHFPISRNLFLMIQYSDLFIIHYWFWFSLLNHCFRICNSQVFFFVLACYCLQLIIQKQLQLSLYLTVIYWVCSYCVFDP